MTSRRVFLKSGAMAMISLGFAPSFLARTASAASPRKKLLVAIFQRGAVDGLNMIVPFGDAEYFRARPTIAIAAPGRAGGAIDLDGFFGLHPRLSSLEPLWDAGHLAIVHACGSHDATRSHFDAQDYMESATPGVKSTRDGWLNRYLVGAEASAPRAAEHSPLRAVALTETMPRSLQGRAPALAMGRAASFGLTGARAAFESAYAASGDTLLSGTAAEAFEAMRMLARTSAGPYHPSNNAEYPPSPFGQALQEIGRLAKADVGLEIAFAESTQWDHHVNEGGATGQIANRLDDFSRGLAALVRDLGDRMADTVILTMSEFGRAVSQNGGGGTDHGHGNAMFVIGGPVKGGRVYGRWPGLAVEQRFEGRDLEVTTDFRDVFGEVVVRHLGADLASAAKVFPGYKLGTEAFHGILEPAEQPRARYASPVRPAPIVAVTS
jgi:uncharacterized protein (DUF1501 family)